MLLYFGVTCYGNFTKAGGQVGELKVPAATEAGFSLRIANTGGVILTNHLEQIGETQGEIVFVLKGYWELVGNRFTFRNDDLILDEKIYGKISVKRR